ncbi:ATP-binding protein [Streptomyces sp. NPDC003697]
MAHPLRKQAAAERPPGSTPTLHYNAAWDTDALRIADARHAVRAFLLQAGHTGDQRVAQDAQLIVSELVTNTIRHAPGPSGLQLRLTPGDRTLSITVWDTSPELPRIQAPEAQRIGGHGLHLVNTLSDRLEAAALDGGKRVTATLSLDR